MEEIKEEKKVKVKEEKKETVVNNNIVLQHSFLNSCVISTPFGQKEVKDGKIEVDKFNIALVNYLKNEGFTAAHIYTPLSDKVEPIKFPKKWIFKTPHSSDAKLEDGSISLLVNGEKEEYKFVKNRFEVNNVYTYKALVDEGYEVAEIVY